VIEFGVRPSYVYKAMYSGKQGMRSVVWYKTPITNKQALTYYIEQTNIAL